MKEIKRLILTLLLPISLAGCWEWVVANTAVNAVVIVSEVVEGAISNYKEGATQDEEAMLAATTLSEKMICRDAVNYSSDVSSWRISPAYKTSVDEARARGLTIQRCDELWDIGRPSKENTENPHGYFASITDRDICRQALDFRTDPFQWESRPTFNDSVNEALDRGLDINRCASLTGRENNSPQTQMATENRRGQYASGTDRSLCRQALHWAKHPIEWDTRPAYIGYVNEALDRGLTLQRCAEGAGRAYAPKHEVNKPPTTALEIERKREIERLKLERNKLEAQRRAEEELRIREIARLRERLEQQKRHYEKALEKPKPKYAGAGTGFFVSGGGHLATNRHVIESCKWVWVDTITDGRHEARLLASDEEADLALLVTPYKPDTYAGLRAGRSIRLGEPITVFGFPLPGALSSRGVVTTGNVSALSGLRDNIRVLQISAAVQPGNSGGPLLDESGNIVGVVVAKLDAMKVAKLIGDIPQNVNFAIKRLTLQNFLDANDINYETRSSKMIMKTADIVEQAKKFTVRVECWN